MPARLMLLGASRYQIPQVRIAKALGCEVIALDRDPGAAAFAQADAHEAIDISDIDRVVEAARRYAVDGIVAINDSGVESAAAVSEALGIPGIDAETAKVVTSKALMRQRWEEVGVPSARFRVAADLSDATAAVEKLGAFPFIMKPANSRGGGSRGVSIVDGSEAVEEAFAFAQSFYPGEPVVVEEFLEGMEHSVEAVVHEGTVHIVAVSDKEKTPPPYRVDRSVTYPSTLAGERLHAVCQVVETAIRALGIDWGAVHVELCSTASGPKLFELGARCGGGATPHQIVPFATGVDLFAEVVRISIGREPVGGFGPIFQRGCVYRFLMPRPGVIGWVDGQDAVRGWPGVLDCEVSCVPGDEIRKVRVGADRVGFVVAGAETRDEAVALADRAERHIEFSYAGAA